MQDAIFGSCVSTDYPKTECTPEMHDPEKRSVKALAKMQDAFFSA